MVGNYFASSIKADSMLFKKAVRFDVIAPVVPHI